MSETTTNPEGMEFIAYDRAGWGENTGLDRLTHMPSGNTLLCHRAWGKRERDQARLDWYRNYDGWLTVHCCPEAYSTAGLLLGTVAAICERIERRLNRVASA